MKTAIESLLKEHSYIRKAKKMFTMHIKTLPKFSRGGGGQMFPCPSLKETLIADEMKTLQKWIQQIVVC